MGIEPAQTNFLKRRNLVKGQGLGQGTNPRVSLCHIHRFKARPHLANPALDGLDGPDG